ncbi:MAG: hypothetical protein QF464_03605, partial [Myxococcota bacterium]|nr:hypothetical protein [Myxococcota bacterium]
MRGTKMGQTSVIISAAFVLSLAACGGGSATGGADGTEPDTSAVDAGQVDGLSSDGVTGPRVDGHDFSQSAAEGAARAGRIDDPSGLLWGPKVEGRVGDIRMDNAHVAFVLAEVRRCSGYGYWGGNVRDAVARRPDGSWTPDHFGELFFGWNLDLFSPETVEIVDDGRVSGTAHVRYVGETVGFHFADSVIAGFLNLDPPEVGLVYDYTLGANDRALSLTVTFQNTRSVPVWIDWPIAFTHFGDGAFPYAPKHGFSDLSGELIPYHGLAGREVSYGLISEYDDLTSFFTYAGVSLVQADAFEISPMSDLSRSFHIMATARGPAGLDIGRRVALGMDEDATEVTGQVTLPISASHEETWVVVRKAEDDELVTLAPVDGEGRWGVELLPGAYTVTAYAEHHAASPSVAVEAPTGDAPAPALEIPGAAQVRVSVSETSTGQATPARVTFVRTGETPTAFAPSNVRPSQKTWSGNQSAVAYVTADDALVSMPPGTYQVTASRGPTHEIDQRLVTVEAGDTTDLPMTVEQVIDTTGWLSGDFHIHAWWSPDSYVPWTIRARQAATEDLDLPILTEHVYIGSLADAIEEVGVGDHAIGVTGQEVT